MFDGLPLDGERGVSPTVGVVIMIAVTIIAAVVLLGVVGGFSPSNSNVGTAAVAHEESSDGFVTVSLIGKSPNSETVTVDFDGGTRELDEVGDSVTVPAPQEEDGEIQVRVGSGSNAKLVRSIDADTTGPDPTAPDCSQVSIDDGDGNGYGDIGNAKQLQCMNDGAYSKYELTSDVDARITEYWNDGKGFDPLNSEEFTGRGYEIRDLYINRSSGGVGLFSYNGETVTDLTFVDPDITYSGSSLNREAGVLSAKSTSGGTVDNVVVSGGQVSGRKTVGGLIGYIKGVSIQSSSASTTVISRHGGRTGSEAGGLVGIARGSPTIQNSYATGDVSGGAGEVGGLVGDSDASITNSYATGDVTGNGEYVGGLVGENEGDGSIDKSYATGDVTGGLDTGGLVGQNLGDNITNSYATGSVTGTEVVGGLVGDSRGDTIDNSYATGDVSGNDRVGGLVGVSFDNDVYNSYATGNVTGTDSVSRRQFFGGVSGIIGGGGSYSNVSASGRVKVGGDADRVEVGGFAGEVGKVDIDNSSATGRVVSHNGTLSTGGFVGKIDDGGDTNINNSYSTVTLDANAGDVGGFVGAVGYNARPNINNSYARVDVNAAGSDNAGGFYGRARGDTAPSFRDVYAVGAVNGGTTGGFGGKNSGSSSPTYTDAYWDTEVASGQSSDLNSGDETGITGLSSSEMKGSNAESNMDFDFTNVWETVDSDYPELR